MSKQRRILVIRPDRIGDTVCATPLIRGLRETWPDAYIAAMVRPAVKPVLDHNPRLDEVITDDFEGEDKGRDGFWRLVSALRKRRFTHALMLLPTERHTWMTFLAGIPKRVGVGFRPYHLFTFTKRVSRNKYIPLRHEADYSLDQGRAIGIEHDDLSVEVFVTDEERSKARIAMATSGLNTAKPIVSVFPQTGGSAPNWPLERYVELVRMLIAQDSNLQVAVNVPPGETNIIRTFEEIGSERVAFPDKGEGLRMVIGLIAESDVSVSASTGPMHLAAGLKTPTVNIFCPLPACSPTLWGPQGNEASIFVQTRERCDTECHNNPRTCTLHGISPAEVGTAILETLRKQHV